MQEKKQQIKKKHKETKPTKRTQRQDMISSSLDVTSCHLSWLAGWL